MIGKAITKPHENTKKDFNLKNDGNGVIPFSISLLNFFIAQVYKNLLFIQVTVALFALIGIDRILKTGNHRKKLVG